MSLSSWPSIGSFIAGSISIPMPSITNSPSSLSSAPPFSAGRASAPPRWRSSASSSGESDSGPCGLVEGVDRLVRELLDHAVMAEAGHRRLRIHRDPGQARGRNLVEGVHHRLADLAQRRDALPPSSSVPIEATVIANHFLPRIASGMSGIGGRFSIRTMLATSSGACAHQSR